MARQELFDEVKRFNNKYCRNTKNKLVVGSAYGGYQVQLTGKRYKNNPNKWRGIGSGASSVTWGFQTPKDTLGELYKAESKGWLRNQIRQHEKPRIRW